MRKYGSLFPVFDLMFLTYADVICDDLQNYVLWIKWIIAIIYTKIYCNFFCTLILKTEIKPYVSSVFKMSKSGLIKIFSQLNDTSLYLDIILHIMTRLKIYLQPSLLWFY